LSDINWLIAVRKKLSGLSLFVQEKRGEVNELSVGAVTNFFYLSMPGSMWREMRRFQIIGTFPSVREILTLFFDLSSREKARKPHSLLWGGMASGGLGAAAPIMAFSLQ